MPRITLLLVALLGRAACETVQGAGQDISAGGQAISGASEEVQEGL